MRSRKVIRYWCDFCNRGGLQKRAMQIHEDNCTLNPERGCRVCALLGARPEAMKNLLALLPDSEPYRTDAPRSSLGDAEAHERLRLEAEAAMPALRDLTENCPACIMAALRQAKIPVPMVDCFDFKKEMQEIFSTVNTMHAEERGY